MLRVERQSVACQPVGDALPGWKVLRALGSLAGLEGFEYGSSEEVRSELEQSLNGVGLHLDTTYRGQWQPAGPVAGQLVSLSPYATDPIVRRARALQETPAALRAAASH